MARIERRQQRLVDDVAAARHVDEVGALGQQRRTPLASRMPRVSRVSGRTSTRMSVRARNFAKPSLPWKVSMLGSALAVRLQPRRGKAQRRELLGRVLADRRPSP